MDEVGKVSLGRALQAELAVSGHGVVHEDDRVGEAAVVEDLAVVVAQLVLLRLEPELVLVARAQAVHGAHLVGAQRLAEQVDGGHLAAEHPLLVHVRRRADVALVKRLQRAEGRELEGEKTISKAQTQYFFF